MPRKSLSKDSAKNYGPTGTEGKVYKQYLARKNEILTSRTNVSGINIDQKNGPVVSSGHSQSTPKPNATGNGPTSNDIVAFGGGNGVSTSEKRRSVRLARRSLGEIW